MADSPPLLVPITADALLVNNAVRNSVGWQRFTTAYGNLNVFEDPVPAPGESTHDPADLADGVHLHWKLPAAITHGVQAADGTVEWDYLAPNRWVVARLVAGSEPVVWVVQSDYLGPDGSTPFANPHTSVAGDVVVTQLGRNVELGKWAEPGEGMFLEATGLADATFTAWQPGLVDVFSFADPMTGVAPGTEVSYLIAGWYSDPTEDPLAKKTPDPTGGPPAKKTPADLGWTVLGGDATPTRSVYHSLVMEIEWQTTTAPPRADTDASSMQLAVGYTSVDAMAAMIASLEGAGPPAGAKLATELEAFQRGLLQTLDKPGGPAALEQEVRSSWFAGTGGGTMWEIVAVAQGQETADPLHPAVQPPPPVLNEDQAKWIAALNVAQRAYDQASRALETAQWELFALWWKDQLDNQYAKTFSTSGDNPDTNPAIPIGTILTALDTAVATQLTAVQAQQQAVAAEGKNLPDPTSQKSIEHWSTQIPDNTGATLALKARTMPPFMRPLDPVVLIGGITPPEEEPDATGGLPCRLATAAVTGVNAQGQAVTSATGSLGGVVPAIPGSNLDPAVAPAIGALATESFFADSANAALILSDGLGVTDPNAIATLTSAMAAGTAQISTITDPLAATWAFQTWTQAWAPLFLQWEIDWRATLSVNQVGDALDQLQDNWPYDPTQWTFDGGDDVLARGGEYYAWKGPDNWSDDENLQPGDGIQPNTYTGRTFLTPHASAQLVKRLEEYVKLHPDADLEQIEKLIDQIGETRFLSQALSGFNEAFLTRALQHTPPPDPDSPIGKAVGGQHQGVPVPSAGATDQSFGGGTPFFFPLRGGFFQFNKLEIVDAFGQVLDLLQSNGNKDGGPATFKPIYAQGLAPDAGTTLPQAAQRMKQAPRVVQPSRLDMRLLDSENDASEVGLVYDADPICGWVLPNHLDQSLAAYDPAGVALGELLVAADPDTHAESVVWLPAPGGDAPSDPSQIKSKHLREALMAFTDTAAGGGIQPVTDRPAALRALYASIDETLWTIEPGGGQGDQDLAALIGPPLALVRAELQFELYGQPAYNQGWRDSTLEQTAGFTTIPLEIRVGSTELIDDGVVGYYTGANYTAFSASHVAGPASPHVKAIAPGNYLSLPFDYPAYTKQQVTLLVDPRGSVHATTGVLPIADMQVPAAFYEPALGAIAATFRIGPVLTDPAAVRMPIPGDRRGTWSWISRTAPGNTEADFATSAIVPADQQARLGDSPPHMVDGWLRFKPDSVEGGS